MNGNITKEGIKLDLEWMHRIGLGGVEIVDASMATPQVVTQRLAYMTPSWRDAFKYAITLGDELGLEGGIASSPGWSLTGGPWVPAPEGMKKYVWSETVVQGGKPFTGTLARPPSNTGPFQNIGGHDAVAAPEGTAALPQFYADAAVIAYRRPQSDEPAASLHPIVSASTGVPDMALLSDGDLEKITKLPIPKMGEISWLRYEFVEPQTIRALTIAMKEADKFAVMLGLTAANPERSLEASDDGQTFREIAKLPAESASEHTISFPPVRAQFFRITFKKAPLSLFPAWPHIIGFDDLGASVFGPKLGAPPTDYEIAELVLHPGARVNRFEGKAAFVAVHDLYQFATPSYAKTDVIAKSDIIDLSEKLRPDGTLDWTPPAGNWVVLRFGYSLLGVKNHPATAEATGLEVDKLNRGFVKNYMNHYLDSYLKTVGADYMGKRGIRYLITDSWEAGSQNWTDDMIDQFKRRRGYDPRLWMPVLAGKVVESSEASDRFLWDFRKTIADLVADEHNGQVQASLKERGLSHYGESHEFERTFIADGMEVKKFADIPMGAMWVQRLGTYQENFSSNADDRESASVAHIYGQNIAAAESMTAAVAAWAWSPATLKPTADAEFLNGINRIVIHSSAHQPLVGKAPGLTLGPFGQWFNRNETWAENAGPWISYLARCSYLLQQGHFVADLLYFYGEDSNLTAIFRDKAPEIPAGFGFDYINADGLIHELSVAGNCITTKSGMSYRVLGLAPYSQHMSLPVLRGIHQLVQAGGIVVGLKPTDDPSLADDQAEFHRIADELFGDGTGVHNVGKGSVYAGSSLAEALAALRIVPDFDYSKPASDTNIQFVHRKLTDGDLYFVANRQDRAETFECSFRVTGKAPELWRAETGEAEQSSFSMSGDRTTIPLHLEPWGSVFVVFRTVTKETSLALPKVVEKQLATMDGPWSLGFQADRGAPSSITLSNLISWSDHPDKGVKYFSGSGTYRKTINASNDWFKSGTRLWIDLGDVKNVAEVSLNGKSLGVVWHAPYRVEVTDALRPGTNEIAIKATNSWVNRIIGDEQPDAPAKYTFTTVQHYKANSPLLLSGLLGPVVISSTAIK